MESIRTDLVFSYWIYVWYLLYIYKFIMYSPKFALLLGLIDNIVMLFLMINFGTSKKTIFYFILINTIIKIVPLYYLRHQKILMKDIGFTFFLFIIFIFWLHINKQSLIGNLKLIHDSLLYGKNKTPFLHLLDNIKRNFKNLNI